jgi:HD-like signal output (HDOD) protein
MTTPTMNLDKVVSGEKLPALPQSAVELLRLSHNPKNGPVELAVPIESDPGLAMQVLRFVNSSYFGFARKISTVRSALMLVGADAVKNFVLWSALFSSIPDPKCGSFDLKVAWQDSLRRALFARTLAKKLGVSEADDPFPAALLQDVALPLLIKAAPQVYAQLLADRSRDGGRLSEMERRAFGWTHAEAGAVLCRKWNLPERLASLIEDHVETDPCIGANGNASKAAVALSALLPSTLDSVWAERELFDRLFEQTMPSKVPEIANLFGEVDRQYSELAPMLRLPSSVQPLTEAMMLPRTAMNFPAAPTMRDTAALAPSLIPRGCVSETAVPSQIREDAAVLSEV